MERCRSRPDNPGVVLQFRGHYGSIYGDIFLELIKVL